MRTFILILLLSFPFLSFSQEGFPLNGVEDNRKNYYAFTNAKIFVDYKNVIESGTLIIKNGKIISVGKDIDIPDGVRTFDLNGSYVYPSFVDLYTDYAIVKNKRGSTPGNWMSSYTNPQMISNKNGPFSWNESIRPEYNSVENIKLDEKRSKTMRKEGFGSVVSHNMDGIIRGTGTFLSLSDDVNQKIVLKDKSTFHF